MSGYKTYVNYKKPSWAPPSWVFGPVWTFLYILIAISFGKVFIMAAGKEITFGAVLPFILNLIFNFAFIPIQFGLKNNLLASVDIILIFITLVWTMASIFPLVQWITYINIPYLIWVCIATTLQFTITKMNWKKR